VRRSIEYAPNNFWITDHSVKRKEKRLHIQESTSRKSAIDVDSVPRAIDGLIATA
jgi:hypothetical protein